MKIINFNIVKLTALLILGVIIGSLNIFSIYESFTITTLLFALYTISFFIAKKRFIKTIWFGVISFLLMVSIGILTVNIHNQKNFKSHYSHTISSDSEALNIITFKIREVLKPGNYYDKYVIDILNIDGEKTTGKSLLNLQKDSLLTPLRIDAIYICKTKFKTLISPLNPNQFNYKKYLDKKYIYHQIFTTNEYLYNTNTKKQTLFGVAYDVREYINSKLKLYHFSPDELAIINALLLGQRQDISKEIYTNYTNAGAIHILAISGLHIGIILLILNFIFSPLVQIKYGSFIKTVLLLLILWSFAIVAELSASVTRAVTMFSIIAIAMNLKRPTNIFNTLAISIFVLLLIKPMFLFDVGFQLSYLAVLAIVVIDPILFKLCKPKNKILKFYWHTFTITISAQVGIIPISLYYFHEIASLFFISNLVIIPFLGVILSLGVLAILLAALNILPQIFADFYGNIIALVNNFIAWISQQNTFLIKHVSFNIGYVIASYILIVFIINFWKQKTFKSLKPVLLGIIIFQCTILYTKYNTPSNELIIFHKSRHSIIGQTSNNTINIADDLDSISKSKNKIIENFMVGNFIKHKTNNTLKNLYILNKETLFLIDSLGVYNVRNFKPDYILLRQSPKINLNRLIDSTKPRCIIADGSNYKSYIERWLNVCKKRKLPFHQTSKKGAFIIKY